MPRLAEAAGAPEAGEQLAAEAAERLDGRRARRRGRAPPARGRARVARPGLRRRPLGAADDRAGRRRGRARPAGREVAHGRVGGGRGGGARGRRLDALRLLRRAGRGGDDARRERLARCSARAWSPSTPPRTSRGPGRAWSTASSCSATCCTPSWCRRRRAAARSSWTWGARRLWARPATPPRSSPPPPRRPAPPQTAASPQPGGTRTLSRSSNRTSAARVPPTSPPMWPPIEMPGTVKVISRLSPIQRPRPLSMRLMPAVAHDDDGRAHQPEDRARGARR